MSGWNLDFITNAKSTTPMSGITGSTYDFSIPSLLAGYGNQTTVVTNARYLSYRVVQLGVKVIPDGANLNKQGIITMAMIPGKGFVVSAIQG